MKYANLWLIIGLVCARCLGKAGDLDTLFGSTKKGYTLTNVDASAITGRSVVRQSDGKIVAVGNYYDASNEKYSVIVVRYNSAGIADASFGSSGVTKTTLSNSTIAQCVALQSTGKIIVAANYDVSSSASGITVLRYSSNGRIDKTFGSGKGYIKTFISPMSEISTLVVGTDNKITVGGWYYDASQDMLGMLLVRYTANGTLDTSFGSNGYIKRILTGYPSVLYAMLRSSSYLLATGSLENYNSNEDCVVLKMKMSGALLTSFGSGKGYTKTSISGAQRDVGLWLALQKDGKIVVAGEYFDSSKNHYKLFLTRYKSNGVIDTTFGSTHKGIVKTSFSSGDDFVSSVVISGSTIIMIGSCVENFSSKLALARYKANGSRDTTFGTNGIAKMPLVESWSNGAFITGGKLVVVGGSNYSTGVNRLMLARFKLA